MKSLQKNVIQTEEAIKMIDMIKTLSHPNILQLVELLEDEEKYYIITEFYFSNKVFFKLCLGTAVVEICFQNSRIVIKDLQKKLPQNT